MGTEIHMKTREFKIDSEIKQKRQKKNKYKKFSKKWNFLLKNMKIFFWKMKNFFV